MKPGWYIIRNDLTALVVMPPANDFPDTFYCWVGTTLRSQATCFVSEEKAKETLNNLPESKRGTADLIHFS